MYVFKCMHRQQAGRKVCKNFCKIMQKLQNSAATLRGGIHKQKSGPVLLTQGLRGFEGLGKKFAAGILLHEGDTQNTQCKNSSFQFILKMPASQLQQFWVIAWSCHLPCEVCDVLQQRSLFSFKSQLEKTVSIPLSLMCKEISEYSPRNKCSTYLIKYVNDIKVN